MFVVLNPKDADGGTQSYLEVWPPDQFGLSQVVEKSYVLILIMGFLFFFVFVYDVSMLLLIYFLGFPASFGNLYARVTCYEFCGKYWKAINVPQKMCI